MFEWRLLTNIYFSYKHLEIIDLLQLKENQYNLTFYHTIHITLYFVIINTQFSKILISKLYWILMHIESLCFFDLLI